MLRALMLFPLTLLPLMPIPLVLLLLLQGIACNVGRADEVRALADYAKAQLGHIDVW